MSNSPETLLKEMHLPVIRYKDGVIVGRSGQPVVFFINGVRADKIDIATFWPKNAKRVEYIERPADPMFEGVPVAVNFIMTEYEVGGVSRFNGTQKVPDNGYYSTSTKAVYKKMTYGLLLSGSYYRDHRTTEQGSEVYKDLNHDGNHYDRIERSFDESSYSRDESLNVSVNARYTGDSFRATHTLSFGWMNRPGSGGSGSSIWTDNMFGSDTGAYHSDGRSVTPQVSGNYYKRFSAKWYLTGGWSYAYGSNNNNMWNQTGDAEKIVNGSREHVNSCKLWLQPYFRSSEKLIFQMNVKSDLDWFSTQYSGSNDSRSSQSRQELSAGLNVFYEFSPDLWVTVEPGLSASIWKIGSNGDNTVRPTGECSVNWTPNSKLSLGGSLRFYLRPTPASESTPVIIKYSELMWLTGNDRLRNLTSWDSYLYSTFIATPSLRFSLGAGYVRTVNSIIYDYIPAAFQDGGLIKHTLNADPVDNVRVNMNVSYDLGDVTFSITPEWYYTRTRGLYASDFNHFCMSGGVDYSFGNCRAELRYDGPYKDMTSAGMERSWTQDCWNFMFTFGKDNLYMNVGLENLFNNKRKSWTSFTSPHYSSYMSKHVTGRKFVCTMTYTFDYGKKVDRRIDISGPESIKTSVLAK